MHSLSLHNTENSRHPILVPNSRKEGKERKTEAQFTQLGRDRAKIQSQISLSDSTECTLHHHTLERSYHASYDVASCCSWPCGMALSWTQGLGLAAHQENASKVIGRHLCRYHTGDSTSVLRRDTFLYRLWES